MNEIMSPTVAKIAEALAAAQGEMSGAKKEVANSFFKSKYADLAAVIGSIREPFAAHGIAHTQMPGADAEGHFVDTLLIHSSGEWLRSRIYMNPTKEDPQGIGSVITYMRRYALQAMAGLEAEDDDGNGATHGKDWKPGDKPALKPLPAGSCKTAETVSTPKPKYSDKAGPDGHPDEMSKTGWKDVICHLGNKGGPVNGKRLGDISQKAEYMTFITEKLAGIKEPSQQDNLLKAALAMREAELNPTPAQAELSSSRVNLEALRAKAEAAKIPLDVILKVARNIGPEARSFDTIDEMTAGYMVANWKDTLAGVAFEQDDIPNR